MDKSLVPFSFFTPEKQTNDSFSLHNKVTGKSFDLNSGAALIALLSDGTRTVEEVVEEFSTQFGAERSETEENVLEFLDDLFDSRFIVYRRSKLRSISPPSPDYLILELTNRCNLNCIHCSVSANDRIQGELSSKEWLRVIDQAAELGVRAVGLSGGEPLLREDFFEIARYARNRGFLVGLVTNGLLIDEDNVGLIKDLGLDVQVSLDGSEAKYHNRMRACSDCFNSILEKFTLLKNHGVDFTVAGVATAENYKDLPDLLELAETVGARSFRVQPFFPVGRGAKYRNELDLTPEATKYISSFLLEAADKSKIDVGGFYFQFALDKEASTGGESCEVGSCAAGSGFAGITHDGFVYPCSHIWQLSEENVKEKPLGEIWVNSRLFNFFRSLMKMDTSLVCQSCKYFSKCRGGCKAMNILDGAFSEPDYHCWIADNMHANQASCKLELQ